MHIDSLANGTWRTASFDVFDTVLLRRCTTPEGVFERAFDLAGIPEAHQGMREAFVQHRQMAETRAREAAMAEFGSGEATIEEIYRRFPTRIFGLERADWPRLVRAEFQAECELCFANPAVLARFEEMRRAGLRCGLISDTYWNARRLGELLRQAAPALEWDFLYSSCDNRRSKSEGLFTRLLADEEMAPELIVHLGDNEWADVRAARRHGLHAIHLPQCTPGLAGIFEREATLFDLLTGTALPRRLDGGNRTIRRVVAAAAPSRSPAFSYGLQVLGPILAAFQSFIADRLRRIRRTGGKVAVAFIARDGLLPFRLWQELGEGPAHYVEVNRRIALIGGAVSLKALGAFFRDVPRLDQRAAQEFLKIDTPALRTYFAQAEGGTVSGKTFAAALPGILADCDVAALSAAMRTDLLAHLRARIPDFDQCSDLVLVDLGYAGTVQRQLRTIFTAEELPHRLHGLYLLTEDEAFTDLPDSDSAEGFLSDRVLTPHAKRAILNNIALIEQLCSAPQGSVTAYEATGEVRREPDPRPQTQLALCAQVQDGALHFAHARAGLSGCLHRPETAAPWVAAMLARAVLLPTDEDLILLGGVHQDINLGSQALAPLLDAPLARALTLAKALPSACTAHQPPMWPAAGMAALSPLHGYHYALFATGRLPADVAGDIPCGTADVVVMGLHDGHPLTVTRLRTGEGDVRLRIPLLAKTAPTAVVLPAAALPASALIRGIALQQGDTTATALASEHIELLAITTIKAMGINLSGDMMAVQTEDGCLVLGVPALRQAVAVMTVTLTPLTGARVLALA